MSYQVYKMIHIVGIVLFFSSYAIASIKTEKAKRELIINGISLVLIIVSGMGLIARIGIPHGEPWPIWLNVKLGIWIVVGMSGHIVLKRFPKLKGQFFWVLVGFLVLASYMANYKIG